MTHSNIDVGDVVYDLAGGGSKMVVVERVADTIEEHRESEDYDLATYKSHPNLPVREDDAVFKCVFIPDGAGSQPGSGTYDFPAGRLARAPIEQANADLERIQDVIVRNALEEMFLMGSAIDSTGTTDHSRVDALHDLASEALDEAIVEDAHELARSRDSWQSDRKPIQADGGSADNNAEERRLDSALFNDE